MATALGGCGDHRELKDGVGAFDSDAHWPTWTDTGSATDSESETQPLLISDRESGGDSGDQGGDTASEEVTDSATDLDTDTAITTATCVEFTRSEESCSDCCDCLLEACAERDDCRVACGNHNYGNNRSFIDFEVPTDPNREADYATCLMRGEVTACDACCDCRTTDLCGDIKYCRTACTENLY